jgi:hypothetical protein
MPTLDTRQTPTTVYIYSNVVEQVLQANVRHLKEQLKTDPACNVEFILETLAVLEATLLTIKEARD